MVVLGVLVVGVGLVVCWVWGFIVFVLGVVWVVLLIIVW
jgi:hypothetical protein